LKAFKIFVGKESISAQAITEKICRKFQDFLLEKYHGETPSGYFMRFKRVLKKLQKKGISDITLLKKYLPESVEIKN
jgi:Phage integrase SAM-like domain